MIDKDALVSGGQWLLQHAGPKTYRLEVPAAPTAIGLSVVSFKAVEALGKPYEVTVQLTHPLELDRADYLNRPATFVIDPGDGSEPRRFAGWIPAFSKTRQTRDFQIAQDADWYPTFEQGSA